jgi:hypothetical protein
MEALNMNYTITIGLSNNIYPRDITSSGLSQQPVKALSMDYYDALRLPVPIGNPWHELSGDPGIETVRYIK